MIDFAYKVDIFDLKMTSFSIWFDLNRIFSEKETEAENIRKNTSATVVAIQQKLEAEIRVRSELVKSKKKTESQISDLESQISSQTKAGFKILFFRPIRTGYFIANQISNIR